MEYCVLSGLFYFLKGGDAAAHAAAAGDLRGTGQFLEANVGLSVLATCIIDYAGHRMVAQAIVPGILRRDQTPVLTSFQKSPTALPRAHKPASLTNTFRLLFMAFWTTTLLCWSMKKSTRP